MLSIINIDAENKENYERILGMLPETMQQKIEDHIKKTQPLFENQVQTLLAGKTNKGGFFSQDMLPELLDTMVPYLAAQYSISPFKAKEITQAIYKNPKQFDIVNIENNKLLEVRPKDIKHGNISIPGDVTSIEEGAFYNCKNLTFIFIPDSVTSIGSEAFYGCNNLISIVMPKHITSIEEGTFKECRNLTSIVIPDSVTSIGKEAFRDCNNLTSIVMPKHMTAIKELAFYDCGKLASIVIPDGVTTIGKGAFCMCSNLTSIVIPDSVTLIEEAAFAYCNKLSIININARTKDDYERVLKLLPNDMQQKIKTNRDVFEEQATKLLTGQKNKGGFFSQDVPRDLLNTMVPYLAAEYGLPRCIAEEVTQKFYNTSQNVGVKSENDDKGLSV